MADVKLPAEIKEYKVEHLLLKKDELGIFSEEELWEITSRAHKNMMRARSISNEALIISAEMDDLHSYAMEEIQKKWRGEK